MSKDFAVWYAAQLDAAEERAKAATPGPWRWVDPGGPVKLALVGPEFPRQVVASLRGENLSVQDAEHIAVLDPKWRLADLAAKRAILAEHPAVNGWDGDSLDGPICDRCCTDDLSGGREGGSYPCQTLRLLAVEFAGADGYDEAWRPE